MAGVNEILDGRLNLALSRRLGMTSGPATTLAPEIMPMLSLGEMPELLYHSGWRRWQHLEYILSAGATTYQNFQVRCPDTSTSIYLIEHIEVGHSPANPSRPIRLDLGYGPGGAALANASVNAEFRDSRQSPSGNTSLEFSNGSSNVLVPGTAWGNFFGAQPPLVVPGAPWVLMAGAQMLFQVENQIGPPAEEYFFTVVWRERALVSGEQMP